MTEHATSDNFWSWRDAMYKLALNVTPDQMESIATMLYSEMVRHGYTNVADMALRAPRQKWTSEYDNLSELGSRMIAAAKTALVLCINITLDPHFLSKRRVWPACRIPSKKILK